MSSLKIKRGTLSNINTAASANGLNQGELYLITDTAQLAIGLSSNTYEIINVDNFGNINLTIDGGGSAITTGIKADLVVAYDCTITSATLLADQTGSIVIDIWKDTYANFPPTDADSITASAPPTLSSASKSQDATLTGWTTSLSTGQVLRFNVDSISTITKVNLTLAVVRI